MELRAAARSYSHTDRLGPAALAALGTANLLSAPRSGSHDVTSVTAPPVPLEATSLEALLHSACSHPYAGAHSHHEGSTDAAAVAAAAVLASSYGVPTTADGATGVVTDPSSAACATGNWVIVCPK